MKNTPLLTPIAVDLDGTLIKTDFLYESFILFIKTNPLNAFLALFWLITHNRAYMKSRIAERINIDVSNFPYNQELITWLKKQKSKGHPLLLATASHQKYALAINMHLQLFDEVIGTSHSHNLKGNHKEEYLTNRYGKYGYDYAGDSTADLVVWKSVQNAIVVGNSKIYEQAKKCTTVSHHFTRSSILPAIARAMRPHQWLKNSLIFVPLFTSHSFTQASSFFMAITGFIAFSLCASSVYILNDFLDLQADRTHPTKKTRPFASGSLSIPIGFMCMLACLLSSIFIATYISTQFLMVLLMYLGLTSIYSFYLKHVLVADIIVLSCLYTLRIISGAVVIDVTLSFWLLSFSMFLFLSLSIVKRHAELYTLKEIETNRKTMARSYHINDLPILTTLGCISGYIAALLMALYVNSDDIQELYQHPQILWLIFISLLYWISRVWILTNRGEMNDDPVRFVLNDPASRWLGLLIITVIIIAA